MRSTSQLESAFRHAAAVVSDTHSSVIGAHLSLTLHWLRHNVRICRSSLCAQLSSLVAGATRSRRQVASRLRHASALALVCRERRSMFAAFLRVSCADWRSAV